MSAENRLTAEQLAALAPGDTVTIESGLEFARRRYTTGTIVRITGTHAVVRCGSYLEEYRLRDGLRVGGVGRAELVHADGTVMQTPEERRRRQRIDVAYREWTRDRDDVERLRRLHAAIEECLERSS